MKSQVVTVVYRGDFPESRHSGSIAVVDRTGEMLAAYGDPERMTFLRSAAKPFQVLPLFETGAYERYGFSLPEIAVMAGSHSGEDMHAEQVMSILNKIGLSEEFLQCGVQPPFHRPTAQRLKAAGGKISPLRNACSGKHACMLAIVCHMGWDLDSYMEINHPVQQLMLKTVAELMEFPVEAIKIGIDTCGVPVFAIPLRNMALGYSRLAQADSFSGKRRQGIELIQQAMAKYPELIAGTGRFTTELLQATQGLVAKDGGESSFGVGVLSSGLGIALKIEDGADRAMAPAVMETLEELAVLTPAQVAALQRYKVREIKTYGGVVAGRIEPVKYFAQ
ncbi:MAG: asparaginase [bacterium]|jgi:L-asparaginase II